METRTCSDGIALKQFPARPLAVTSFYLVGAGDTAFLTLEAGGKTRQFQFTRKQIAELGYICLHVAQRLEQGKSAP